jgi:hypothetical protein
MLLGVLGSTINEALILPPVRGDLEKLQDGYTTVCFAGKLERYIFCANLSEFCCHFLKEPNIFARAVFLESGVLQDLEKWLSEVASLSKVTGPVTFRRALQVKRYR